MASNNNRAPHTHTASKPRLTCVEHLNFNSLFAVEKTKKKKKKNQIKAKTRDSKQERSTRQKLQKETNKKRKDITTKHCTVCVQYSFRQSLRRVIFNMHAIRQPVIEQPLMIESCELLIFFLLAFLCGYRVVIVVVVVGLFPNFLFPTQNMKPKETRDKPKNVHMRKRNRYTV